MQICYYSLSEKKYRQKDKKQRICTIHFEKKRRRMKEKNLISLFDDED
jgi:hypothetical protein